jgi:hypothetical protein
LNKTKTRVEKAILLATEISAADGEAESSRRHHDNLSRQRRLDLGQYLIEMGDEADEAIKAITLNGLLTSTEISDIMAVATWNQADWHYFYNDVKMSFTVNRTLAGVRVKRRKGFVAPSYEQTLTAVYEAAARNGGFVVEDEYLRVALAVLPAPNSLEHIIERANEDPEYKQELRDKGVYVLPKPPVDPPYPRVRDLDPWVTRLVNLKADIAQFRDAAFADEHTPIRLVSECREMAEILNGVAALIEGRKAMDQVLS